MNKIFQAIGGNRPKKSAFDLSHEKKLSFDMGDLVPMYLQEIIPGDQFKVKSEVFMRLAPMIAPMMHRVNVYIHYFFVPNRIIWNEWETFITGGDDGITVPTFPKYQLANGQGLGKGSLSDYLGIPVQTTDAFSGGYTMDISELPHRAYHTIWNEYYRDQNLQTAFDPNVDIGFSFTKDIRQRAWEKDYFTSALTNPQKGPDLQLPVDFDYLDQTEVYRAGPGQVDPAANSTVKTGTAPDEHELKDGVAGIKIENIDPNTVQATIRDLRQAVRLQEWFELSARAGTRYVEKILSHFGVRSSDARLQRPEYLGGGQQPVMISEVLNTAGDPASGNTAVGDMAGHGIAVGSANRFNKRFEEHGYVMGIMSVLPKTTYQDGLHRMFKKFDKLDYYWPEFAHIGEQAVLNEEVRIEGKTALSADVAAATFGYQQRYAEYKHQWSTVHGDYRDTLDFWHMGRQFTAQPALNEAFIKSAPTKRIFAVDDGTHSLWCQIYNDVKAVRPIPYFTDPRL